MNPIDHVRIGPGSRERVCDANPFQDENFLLELDFADRFAVEGLDLDSARCQRAPEGSGQSPRGRGDHVVECRRVWREGVGGDAVVLGDRAVNSEPDRLRFGRQKRATIWSLFALDANGGTIDDLAHRRLLPAQSDRRVHRIPSMRTLLVQGLTAIAVSACLAAPSEPSPAEGELPDPSRIRGSRVRTLLPPDAIPAIDDPRFVPAASAGFMRDDEPVIGVVIDGQTRAYSTWHLDRHEIVNDHVGDSAIAVTW